jgi:hypothetical protein
MAPRIPLIHIGIMKSGSTFLQKKVLIEKHNFNNPFVADQYHPELIDRLFCVNPFEFDAKETREFFDAKWRESPHQDHVPLVTLEELAGNPLAASNYERETSHRLKDIFPEAKILITIREQRSVILSSWCHYLRKNGPQPISRFVGKANMRIGFLPICRPHRYRYDALVAHYYKLFGRENVCALPAEWLFENQQAFARKVMDFADCDYQGNDIETAPPVNPAYTPMELVVRHLAGKFFHNDVLGETGKLRAKCIGRTARLAAKLTPSSVNQRIKQKWYAYIDAYTEGFFEQSNAKLEKIIGMDLRQYGYRCSA